MQNFIIVACSYIEIWPRAILHKLFTSTELHSVRAMYNVIVTSSFFIGECDCHDYDYDLITPDCQDDCLMQEFCEQACMQGVGGPECGCPDHPVGK